MAMCRGCLHVQRDKMFSLIGTLSSVSYFKYAPISRFHRPMFTGKLEDVALGTSTLTRVCGRFTMLNIVMKLCSVIFAKCWNCETELPPSSPFCETCNTLQPLDKKLDYFKLMGIERVYNIDTQVLAKTFRKLQVQFHPDKFSLKAEKEHQMAMEHSSAINKAYRVLQHPVERAVYLLDLAGEPLHEGQLVMDQEFLMEIMELNEELVNAKDKDTVQVIGQRNQKILSELLREADVAFARNDIETARKVVAKIKYYYNIYEKIRDYERERGILD
ncbi:co-chaperone protein HscB homolog isoform X1 [Procambarus clarkii]|uniref:co-chaperone protein HscB homolog isoform X1 n=1 Tax=Procambarus clarkii TaxID=6728 RepID=UPI001E677DC3|nr:co-chaperone protein HscB-like isoform X1 [Procambarus clarkii]